MWQRTEGNTDRCPCGGTAEKWELLTRGKRVASATFCPLCDPQIALLVSRLNPHASQHGAAEAAGGMVR